MTGLHGTTDVATITMAFPSMPPYHQGPITLKTLLKLQEHLINCAVTFRVDGRAMGYLDLAVGQAIYALYTANAYPARTADPGPRVIYTANANALAQKNQENVFAIDYKNHHNEKNMDRALTNRLYAMMGPDVAQNLRDNVIAIVDPTFLQACDEAVRMWGHTTPTSRASNLENLKAAWHPTEGMAKLWRNIKDTVAFAVAANAPIPPEQIIDAALICIVRTQAYKQAYLAFKSLPLQNYTTLRTHFAQAERDRNEVEDEAGAHGYGMAAEAADREMQKGLTDVAAALTSMASGETVNSTITGNSFPGADQIQATLARMEANMGQMQNTIAVQQAQIAAAAQQQPQAAPAMPYAAPMQRPPAQPYMAPMQRLPLQPIQMHNQGNAPTNYRSNNTRGSGNNARPSNPKHPVKRYENQNYCHTCGFDVESTHNSQTCQRAKPGHQFNATRFNTLGGSMAGSHKTVMPSAAGRVCAEAARPQREMRRPQQRQGGMQAPQNGYQQGNRWRSNNQYNQQQQFGGNMQQQQPVMQQQQMPQQMMMQQQHQMAPPPGFIQQGSGIQPPGYGQQWGM